ncbi:aminotransferase class-III [Russula ochroleuca]|uniref:Aminotransferase class-III n=1 Tax=Russula ochroleuca TaxID=152965 RepID=A0A9P5MPY2_9AGAM|nr:aminotransferase class-III [Russula ochroleuca]
MVRSITRKQNITMHHGALILYSGRTFGAMAATESKIIYAHGFLPLMVVLARVLTAPFPFPYWHYFIDTPGADESELVCASLYQVELLFSQQTARMDTTAIIINPVLSEGGHVPPPPTFLQGLRVICNKHGLLLIIDEAQSGSGRMGQVFCIEYSEVKPDIMVIAKGLANGFPFSSVVSKKELADK